MFAKRAEKKKTTPKVIEEPVIEKEVSVDSKDSCNL